jgi:hypothetical protein
MAKHMLTIIVDDTNADEDVDPIDSAISNLEYDGFEIVKSAIEYEVDDK